MISKALPEVPNKPGLYWAVERYFDWRDKDVRERLKYPTHLIVRHHRPPYMETEIFRVLIEDGHVIVEKRSSLSRDAREFWLWSECVLPPVYFQEFKAEKLD